MNMSQFGFQGGTLLVRLENNEKGYYSNLHQQADPHDTNKIGGAEAVQFFKRSGLPIDDLKKIWLISSSNGETLNREEFYIALKLISYTQNGIEVSKESIQRQIPCPLPKFQTKIEENQQQAPINEDIYKIHPEQEKKYQAYVKQLDPYNTNHIQTTMALQLFMKSQLPEFAIQSIMNIVEPGLNQKLKITVQQYTVVVHLISLNRQGITIPTHLPSTLLQYIQNQGQQVQIPNLEPQTNFQSDFSQFRTFQSSSTSNTPKIVTNFLSNSTNNTPKINNNLLDFDDVVQNPTPQKRLGSRTSDNKYSAFDEVPQLIQQNKSEPNLNSENDTETSVKVVKQNNLESSLPPLPQKFTAPKYPKDDQNGKENEIQQTQHQNNKQNDIQLSQIKQIQSDYSTKYQEKQSQVEQVHQNISLNVQECNLILNELKAQNGQMLMEKQQEVEVLETLNEQYRTIVQKFRDEADDLKSEMKLIEDRRRLAIHQISGTVTEINSQLGLNLKIRDETTRKSSTVNDDISSYTQGILQDFKKTFIAERQQRQQIDENLLKELKEQRTLVQNLEKQMNKMSSSANKKVEKIDYSMIDRQPVELTYVPSEDSLVKSTQHDIEERNQVPLRDILRRGSDNIFRENQFISQLPLMSVQVKKTPSFVDYPEIQSQQIETSLPIDMESQSAPLKSQSHDRKESMASPYLQFTTIPSEVSHSQIGTSNNNYSIPVMLDSYKVEGDGMLEKIPSHSEEVQIDLDLTNQFGVGVWNDFDNNYSAFGQPDAKDTDGFGFGAEIKQVNQADAQMKDNFGFSTENKQVSQADAQMKDNFGFGTENKQTSQADAQMKDNFGFSTENNQRSQADAQMKDNFGFSTENKQSSQEDTQVTDGFGFGDIKQDDFSSKKEIFDAFKW